MGPLELSVQVLNISPKVTAEDLLTFFSYCGAIDKLELQSVGDRSQLAVVTFRQPYALQTALLLDDAIILDRRVRIMPLVNASVPASCTPENMNSKGVGSGFNPAVTQSAVQTAAALRGQEVLNKAMEQVLDASRTVISAAEQAVGGIRSAVASRDCIVSKGTLWLSGVLDRASKSVVKLGDAKGKNDNSRKQK